MSQATSATSDALPYADPPQQSGVPQYADALHPIEEFIDRHQFSIAPIVFGLLTLGMFFDVLFSSARVVSSASTDLAMQFIPWREFGFGQLKQGNLPLWNPHIFGGTPYFAGFQAALLYPPNWLHLILPVGVAINWVVALHVFLAGYFTYFWCRGRAVSVVGSILAGVMFMFSGQYFLHVYAGHLPHLAIMVWAPLMLLTVDKLADTGDPRWCILGVFATTMEILAGHPQYVYYTGMILGAYMLLRMIWSEHRRMLLGGYIAMYFGAVLLAAIQLLPGMQAVSEQVRSAGLDYRTAGTFSFPPQNFITLLAPTFFGNLEMQAGPAGSSYWGAGYLWELSLYVSISGLLLSVLGIFGAVRSDWRKGTILLTISIITLLLGLGRHVPLLYWPLFKYLPVYGSFRGTVKFTYLTTLFVALLAGMGFDNVLRNRRISWPYVFILLMLGLTLAALGGIISGSATSGTTGPWGRFVSSLIYDQVQANEYFFRDNVLGFHDPSFMAGLVRISAQNAATASYIAAAMLVAVAAILWCVRYHRLLPYVLVLTATIEMFVFARLTRATMDPSTAVTMNLPTAWRKPLADNPPDQRVYLLGYHNLSLSLGSDHIWGYDPGVLRRYAELLKADQGDPPDEATQYVLVERPPRRGVDLPGAIMRMLRCTLIFYDPDKPPIKIPNPLPVAFLVSNWMQEPGRDAVFKEVLSPTFNPAQTVILESDPGVPAEFLAPSPGSVTIVGQTTDTMEIKATLARPAILEITNNYSTGWRINPIESAQPVYRIMPANYIHMAIPLQAGSHHFVLEYSPLAFRAGRWVSLFALLGFISASVWLMRREPKLR